MSVPPPANPREPLHLRRISCEAFLREDGQIDIEGLLIDTKPMAMRLVSKMVPAGEPIHQMRVCLTIDRERRIVDVHVSSEQTPYPECAQVEARYNDLIGLTVAPGFNSTVKRLFRGVLGCTHITELLPVMASTAFQVIWANERFDDDGQDEVSGRKASPIGGCHALRPDGEVVRTYFPRALRESPP